MNTIDLEVQGMSCGSCVKHVTRALAPISGVSDITVDLPTSHVRVNGALGLQSEQLVSALAAVGYPAKLTETPASPSQADGSKASATNGRGGCCCR